MEHLTLVNEVCILANTVPYFVVILRFLIPALHTLTELPATVSFNMFALAYCDCNYDVSVNKQFIVELVKYYTKSSQFV